MITGKIIKYIGLLTVFGMPFSFAQTERALDSSTFKRLEVSLISGWRITIGPDGQGGVYGKERDEFIGGSMKNGTFDIEKLMEKMSDRMDGRKRSDDDIRISIYVSEQADPKRIYIGKPAVEEIFEQGITGISPIQRAKTKNLLKRTPLFVNSDDGEEKNTTIRTLTITTPTKWWIAIQADGSGSLKCLSKNASATFNAGTVDMDEVAKWVRTASFSKKASDGDTWVAYADMESNGYSLYIHDPETVLPWLEQAIEALKPLEKSRFKRHLKEVPPF